MWGRCWGPGRGLISFVDGWWQKAVFLRVFLRPEDDILVLLSGILFSNFGGL